MARYQVLQIDLLLKRNLTYGLLAGLIFAMAAMLRGSPGAGVPVWLPYLVAAGVFLPLIIRREIPWLSLVLSGGFALFYAFAGIPIARLADRGHRSNLISLALLIWSAMTVASGMAIAAR